MNEDTLYQLVGERIRSARDQAGMSQAKLAEKLKMSRASIVNIEAGRQRPPLHVLWQIAEIVGTEAVQLVPKKEEYLQQIQPISLDQEIVKQIEKAANGDPMTKRTLTAVIDKIRANKEHT